MLWLIFALISFAYIHILWRVLRLRDELRAERGLTELTEEDRNLLKRHIRALEDNTSAQKKGRP